MIKVNIKDAKKMCVWNNNMNIKEERWVICELEDGYLALAEKVKPNNYMEYWHPFVIYRHAEEIKESEWRQFKEGEMPIEYINYLYKDKKTGVVDRPTGYVGRTSVQLRIYNGWKNSQTLFEEKEVSKDGGKTWEPVGVKE